MLAKWLMSDTHCCGHVRGEIIAREINKLRGSWHMDCKTALQQSDLFGADLMAFQRCHQTAIFEWLRDCARLGVKKTYDLDDDFFHVPVNFQQGAFYRKPEVQRSVERFLASVDAVTVSTEALAIQVRAHTERPIYIVENALDIPNWRRPQPQKTAITIGWMASASHTLDAPVLEEPLCQVMSENPTTKLVLIGWVDYAAMPGLRQFGDRVTMMPWIHISQLPDHMRWFDIGLAPLQPSIFNDCKSGLKALQYWANDTPVVCSKSKAYSCVQDGVDGFKVETKQEWYDRLSLLVRDAGLRRKMGTAGFEKLRKRYNVAQAALNWLRVFELVRN